MDNKKIYSIQINGVQENINAIDSLNKQLDKLDAKIAELQKKKIEIDTSISNASSGKSGKENKSALSEEAKLLRNIQNTEAKIKAYSKDIYQNYLASKETLKKTLDDQKEIAAQERLQANTYTYTLNGLKQKLADIKQVMQTTEIGSDMFDKYQREANELTTKLKDLEAKMGVFGRNVGNYQSAADGFNKIKVAVGNTTREFGNYRQAMKELMQERFQLAQSLGQESEQYKEVDLAIRKLESDYKDLNKSSKFMDNMLDTMETFTALGGIGVGFSQLFGLDNSSIDEALKKLTSLFLVLKSFETLNKQWKSGDSPVLEFFKDVDKKIDSWAKNTKSARKAGQEFILNFKDGIESELKSNFQLMDDDIIFEDLKGVFERKGSTKYEGKDLKEFWDSATDAEKENLYVTEKLGEAMKIHVGNATYKVRMLQNAFVNLRRVIMGISSLALALFGGEILSAIGDFIKSLNTAKIKGDELNEELKALNRTLETQRDILASRYLDDDETKRISDEEYLKGIYEAQNSALVKQLELVRELGQANSRDSNSNKYGFIPSSNKNLEFTGQQIEFPTTVGHGNLNAGMFLPLSYFQKDLEVTVENIGEVEKAWEKCQNAIKKGQDYLTANGEGFGDWLSSFFATVKDTEEVMRGLGNIKLSDFIADFDTVAQQFKNGKISAEQYAAELAKLKTQMNDNQVLNSVIANLDKYIPDEKVREAVQNIINEIVRLDDAFNMTSPEQIHYWNQVRIDGMKDGMKKTMALIDENERYEIVQYGKTQKQISLIQQKYERQRENARKNASAKYSKNVKADGKKLADLEDELILLRLNNLKDGLDKQLKLIENQRRVELKKKKEQLKELGVLEASGSTFENEINVKYDKLILDEKRKWAFDMLKIYQDLANGIQDANKSTMEMEVGTATQNVNQKAEAKKTDVGKTLLTPTQFDNPNALEAYYREVIKVEEAAAERQAAIRKEQLDKDIEYNRKAEEQRHERLVNLDGGEYIEQLRAGKITQEQYDKLIEDENDAHYAKMKALDEQYKSDSKQIAIDTMNDVQKAYSDGYGNMIDNIKNEKSKIDEIMVQQPVTDKMGWGIVNIAATSKNYKTALKQYDDLKNDIIAKQKELDMALEKGKIKPEDFAIRSTELKQQAKAIDESTKSITQSQKELIGDFIASTLQYVNALGNSLNSLLSTIWSAADAEFDYQMRQLDKQIDEYENLLDKQKEITQEHADEVNSIEDELRAARGDRRQQLIDNLNAQMAAQRASLAQEKKIEKEKEKLEAKKEREEEEQRKREQERQLVQAIISTALAVANGLATKPFIPTGIAMGALAASLGAAQIAIISSQKYADGGVIEGKSHSQGGVKVLGGRAEVEGGEYITNKATTNKNVEVLDFINSKRKRLTLDDFVDFYGGKSRVARNVQGVKTKFANGGIVPTLRNDIDFNDKLIQSFEDYSNRPVQVAVVDIIDRTQAVNNVKVIAGLPND